MPTRRGFLGSLVAAAGGTLLSSTEAAEPVVRARPDPAGFESGDLLWPKKPGAFVPYNSGSDNSQEQDRAQWLRERDEYVAQMNKVQLDDVDRGRVQLLQNMEYREFLSIYEGDQTPGVPGEYSGGALYVGHVGIVERDADGVPHIVEAVLRRGVIRSTYADWLAARPEHLVWHGRINGVTAEQRATIVAEAKRQLGKPYAFWNFNLNDEQGFYCSKLVWFSVFRALRFALDAKPNPRRRLWLSPKQVLYMPRVDRLHDPGAYGRA